MAIIRSIAVFTLLALSACSNTVLATDACTVAQAATTADPALCTHNAKACAIGQIACAATPGLLAGLVPLTVPAASTP